MKNNNICKIAKLPQVLKQGVQKNMSIEGISTSLIL